jgi:methyltransferase
LSAPTPPWAAFALFLALLIGERLFELRLAARHLPALLARGAVEFGASHYRAIVALHALFPLAILAEMLAGARPPREWFLLLPPIAIAEVLRAASIRELKQRWHVRIWVLPGEPLIRTGIYRWLAHPNYIAVVIELAALPLLFGAWRTAIAASGINAALLAIRIPAESRALRWAAEQNAPSP